jgi:short-subunit dehydrogenase
MPNSLKDKVVVITGGSSGIGRATAIEFAHNGARVVIAARRKDKLDEVCREIESQNRQCLAVETDVASEGHLQRLLDSALERFGRVDIWINNAGFGISAYVEQTSEEEMRGIWAVNYHAVFEGTQIALAQMRKQGTGHIMNVSSMATYFPLPLNAAYTATKCAIYGFTESLSMELEGSGIHATTILPSLTQTEFPKAMVKKLRGSMGGGGGGGSKFTDSPEKVARRIVKCARKPRSVILFGPVPRLAIAFNALVPGFWRMVMRRYIAFQTKTRRKSSS